MLDAATVNRVPGEAGLAALDAHWTRSLAESPAARATFEDHHARFVPWLHEREATRRRAAGTPQGSR